MCSLECGVLVLFVIYDVRDVFLEIGKLVKYSGMNYVLEIVLGVFVIFWFLL